MKLCIKTSTNICCILVLLLTSYNTAYAATENTQTWGQLNLTGSFFNLPKLEYVFQLQGRYNFDPDKFAVGHALGGLGYDYSSTVSFWAGYQWHSVNYLNNTAQENRLWQDVDWQIFNNKTITLTSRSRLEERDRVSEEQWAYRFRQRFTLKAPKMIFNIYTPVIWEELFFNLNKPSWVSDHTFSQNRAFIGVDFPTTDNSFMEVGYLNSYHYNSTLNKIDNVLFFSLNINTG